jgi:2-polyprenyl-3-methyl-5-hydroxy-6-metoxy-1,4-benzoquinol methylase
MDFMVCPPKRRSIITKNLNLSGVGVEVGPILRLVLTKPEYNVYYADYAPIEHWREEYSKSKMVDINKIPFIDFIIGEKYLDEVAGLEKFDYIIASHVIEHVPDL